MKESKTSVPSLFPLSLDSAIFLAIVTAFAYICPYIYQYAYCNTFDIPSSLISIDIITIIGFWTVAFAVVGGFSYLIWTYNILVKDFYKKHPKLRAYVVANTITILSWSFTIYSIKHFNYDWIILVVFIIVANLFVKLNPSIFDSQKVDLLDDINLNTATPTEMDNKAASLLKMFRKILYIIILISASLTIIISITLGNILSKKETQFYVLHQTPSLVVIRIYGDKVICREYNYKMKKLTTQLIVFKINDSKPLQLESRELGTIGSSESQYK